MRRPSDPLLLTDAISTQISCVGPYVNREYPNKRVQHVSCHIQRLFSGEILEDLLIFLAKIPLKMA